MALSKVGGNQIDTVNGDLTVDTNTLHVDASNNRVGVGTASPTEPFHIVGASGAATDMQIQGGDDTNSVRLFMGGNTNPLHGRIVYSTASDFMAFSTGGDQRVRVDSDGLKFGTDSAAANGLDDYEEGEFTVTTARAGATGSDTSPSFTAQYVKIGRMVFIDFTKKGSTVPYTRNGTGGYSSGQAITITSNLPFTPNSSNSEHLGHCRTLNDYDSLGLGWRSGSTAIYLGTGDDNNYVKHNNATTSNNQSNVTIQAQFCYFTTS